MNQKSNQDSPRILTFNGKRYDMSSLPEELKELLTGLRVAETQMHMQEDNLKVLAIGRDAIAKQLEEKLSAIDPLPS